jgi:AcrR family transcriptional regulator
VIGERGLSAPMEEIARRAGVSKQTVYNHYGSKAELVRALMARRVAQITAPLREPGAVDNPREALEAYARSMLETVITTKSYSIMRVIIQGAGEMPDVAHEVFEAGPRQRPPPAGRLPGNGKTAGPVEGRGLRPGGGVLLRHGHGPQPAAVAAAPAVRQDPRKSLRGSLARRGAPKRFLRAYAP